MTHIFKQIRSNLHLQQCEFPRENQLLEVCPSVPCSSLLGRARVGNQKKHGEKLGWLKKNSVKDVKGRRLNPIG